MDMVGYKLIDAQGNVAQAWGGTWGQCPAIPNPIILPNGDRVHCAALDTDYGGYRLVALMMEQPAPAVPAVITRRQCALEMMARGLITPQEALAMTKTGEAPSMVSSMFFQLPTEADRVSAEIDFAADSYLRDNPLLVGLMTAVGASESDIDAFFVSSAAR